MDGISEIVTIAEGAEQIKRMLSSHLFQGSPTKSQLLEFIWNAFVNDESLTEDQIGNALYPEQYSQKDGSSVVRVGVHGLRKAIGNYYAGEGRGDELIVSLPTPSKNKQIKPAPGSQYRIQVSFNPNSAFEKLLRVGRQSVATGLPSKIREATVFFGEALKIRPYSPGALSGLAEAYLLYALLGADDQGEKWLTQAKQQYAGPLVEALPKFWCHHILLGRILFKLDDFEGAISELEIGMDLDPVECLKNLYTRDLLWEIGEADWVLKVTRQEAEREPLNMLLQEYYIFRLIQAQKFSEAEKVALFALEFDCNRHKIVSALSLIYRRTGQREKQEKQDRRCAELMPTRDFEWRPTGWGDPQKENPESKV